MRKKKIYWCTHCTQLIEGKKRKVFWLVSAIFPTCTHCFWWLTFSFMSVCVPFGEGKSFSFMPVCVPFGEGKSSYVSFWSQILLFMVRPCRHFGITQRRNSLELPRLNCRWLVNGLRMDVISWQPQRLQDYKLTMGM